MEKHMAVIMTEEDLENLKQEIISSVMSFVGKNKAHSTNNYSNSLQMYTQEQVAEFLNVSVVQLQNLRELGILKAIKTGKNYMFSANEIIKMQVEYAGYDISNRIKAIEAIEKKKATNHNG